MAEEQREAMEQQAAAPASSLLDEIIEASKIKPTDEGYDVTRAGLQEFIREIAASGTTPKVSGALVDAMIVELDKKLSDQVNEIMHNSQFRELESSWRSLKFLVDNVDFRQNTKVEILNVSKQDLIDDFEDSPEVVKSGLYKHIYTAEFGQFGGQPVGAVVSNYTFGPGPQRTSRSSARPAKNSSASTRGTSFRISRISIPYSRCRSTRNGAPCVKTKTAAISG